MAKPSYGFSALFEALGAERMLSESQDVINGIAFGTMEGASVIGDDITDALGLPEDGIDTSFDDFTDEVGTEVDDDVKALDDTLDEIVDSDDDELSEDMLDETLESLII